MENIEVKIVIPDYEIREWHEFSNGKENELLDDLKSDISQSLREYGIQNFTIEVKLVKK